jgi:DNA-damage-inducible protein D
MTSSHLALFEQQQIRRIYHEEQHQWYFSIIDVVQVLTDSSIPKRYRSDLKKKLKNEWNETYEKIVHFKMIAPDRKMRDTDCFSTQDLFRIIQSIPSPKAEPFKLRLAQVGYQRMQEIEDPELAQERMKQLYEAKWYRKDWIDKRLRWIAIRQNLTDERKERGLTQQSDYAILTAEISKATFGMTPSEYKDFKWLTTKWDNLRDHMTDFELIFTMLWEKVTTEISNKEKPTTMPAHKKVAHRWGSAAKIARQATEKELWRSVISDENYKEKLGE